MQEILESGRFGPISKTIANEILDRFDIVVCLRFDLFDAFGIIEGKIVDDVIEYVLHDAG